MIKRICKLCKKGFLVHFCEFKRNACNFCNRKCWKKSFPKKYTRKEKNYRNVHAWVIRNYGRAQKCENPQCSKKSTDFEWALIKGKKYEKKQGNFWGLCKSCHVKYDFTKKIGNKISKTLKKRYYEGMKSARLGTKHSEKTKEKMRSTHNGNCKCPHHNKSK